MKSRTSPVSVVVCRRVAISSPKLILIPLLLSTLSTLPLQAASQDPAADGPPVGNRGNPALLQFESCKAISPDELRSAISFDAALELASTPSAPLGAYLGTLERQLLAGYQHSGFPDAKVRCDLGADGKSIIVKITEGPRYVAGRVLLKGARQLDAAPLIRALTTEPSDTLLPTATWRAGAITIPAFREDTSSSDITWKAGKPASFDFRARVRLQDAVLSAAAEQGYFWANIDLSFERAGSDAHLVVRILDEGPKAVLETIDFQGLKKNTPEDLRRFLSLEKGKPIDLRQLRDIQNRLFLSGRFTDHKLKAEPISGRPGRLAVTLTLTEDENASGILAQTSPVEQAALQFRQWLLDALTGDADIVAQLDLEGDEGFGAALKVVGNRRDGFAARVSIATTQPTTRPTTQPADPGDPDPMRFVALITPNAVGIHLPDQRRSFLAPTDARSDQWVVTVSVAPNQPPPGTRLSLGGHFQSSPSDAAPLQFEPLLAPVCFLTMLHAASRSARISDGVLVVEGATAVLRIDARTGRLLHFGAERPGDAGVNATLTTERGALMRELALIRKENTWPNDYDRQRPFASMASFMIASIFPMRPPNPAVTAEQRLRAAAALRKLFPPEVFAPVEEACAAFNARAETAYRIPFDRSLLGPTSDLASMAMLAMPFINRIFERGAWPWSYARAGVLLVAGRNDQFASELDRVLASPDTGPLGFYVAAEAMQRLKPALVRPIAQRALAPNIFNEDRFVAECRMLAPAGTVHGRIMMEILGRLQTLDRREIDDIGAILSPSRAAALARLWSATRAHQGNPPAQMLDAVARDLWNQTLKTTLEVRLKTLAAAAGSTTGK